MNNLVSVFLLSSRVVVASLLGLSMQLILLVRNSDLLLKIQEGMKEIAAYFFRFVNLEPQYQVGYNLIGGDNIVVHTFFVLIAYVAILLLLMPFRSRFSSPPRRRRESRRTRHYS